MTEAAEKYICSSCVRDDYVTKWIKEKGEKRTCDYCGKTKKCVITSELCDWVDDVYRRNYQPGEERPYFVDGQDDPNWEMAGSYPEEIIGHLLDAEEAVVNDVIEELADRENYAVVRDCATPYYDTTFCYEDTPVHDFQHSELWDNFCDQVKHHSRFFSSDAIQLLNELFKGIAGFQYVGKKAPIRDITLKNSERYIYRARSARNEKSRIEMSLFPHVELGAPPKNKAIAGRMNPAGIPVLYGALDRKTCLSELRLPVGDIAVSGKFEIIRPLKVMDLTVFKGVSKRLSLFDPRFETKASQLKFLRRFENEISRPVLPGDELLEYIPTQAFVEYLANYHNPKIDGLIYASSQTGGKGKNIVIFNRATRIEPIDFGGNSNGPIGFIEVWMSSHAGYSIFEADDLKKAVQVELPHANEDVNDPVLRFVKDSLEVHKISGVEHRYSSDGMRVNFKKDLENTPF